jgi:phosphonopyruvate decarboxylase
MNGLTDLAMSRAAPRYVNAPNEGEATAYAAGCWLGGGRAGVLVQNSGLGNLYNVLTSLLDAYHIPVWFLIGWRGMPGADDEPQHLRMGAISKEILELAGAQFDVLAPDKLPHLAASINRDFSRRTVAGLLAPLGFIERGAIGDHNLPRVDADKHHGAVSCVRHAPGEKATRRAAIDALAGTFPDAAMFATTGYIGRELYTRADQPNNFYMAGSMGHIAPLALGHADTAGRPVLVLDGDGALLMRLSGLAFVGARAPKRFAHVVLDNAAHESTGAQATLSATTDLAHIASACGYRHCLETDDLAAACELCELGLAGDGPVFVRLRIRTGGPVPERIRIPLPDLAARFRLATSGKVA